MAQQQALVLADGEKLRILISRDGRSADDLAKAWGITRRQLSRYSGQKTLNPKVIKRACEVLGVPESIFDERLNADQLLSVLDRHEQEITALRETVERGEVTIKALSSQVVALQNENTRIKAQHN